MELVPCRANDSEPEGAAGWEKDFLVSAEADRVGQASLVLEGRGPQGAAIYWCDGKGRAELRGCGQSPVSKRGHNRRR